MFACCNNNLCLRYEPIFALLTNLRTTNIGLQPSSITCWNGAKELKLMLHLRAIAIVLWKDKLSGDDDLRANAMLSSRHCNWYPCGNLIHTFWVIRVTFAGLIENLNQQTKWYLMNSHHICLDRQIDRLQPLRPCMHFLKLVITSPYWFGALRMNTYEGMFILK